MTMTPELEREIRALCEAVQTMAVAMDALVTRIILETEDAEVAAVLREPSDVPGLHPERDT